MKHQNVLLKRLLTMSGKLVIMHSGQGTVMFGMTRITISGDKINVDGTVRHRVVASSGKVKSQRGLHGKKISIGRRIVLNSSLRHQKKHSHGGPRTNNPPLRRGRARNVHLREKTMDVHHMKGRVVITLGPHRTSGTRNGLN